MQSAASIWGCIFLGGGIVEAALLILNESFENIWGISPLLISQKEQGQIHQKREVSKDYEMSYMLSTGSVGIMW